MSNVVESLLVELNARTAGYDAALAASVKRGEQFRNSVTDLAKSGGPLEAKIGGAATRVAGAFEQMARSGKVAGEGAKGVIEGVAGLAVSLGIGGPLVAAAGVAGLALFEMFNRGREELKKFQADIDGLQNRGDIAGLTQQAKDLFVGQPSDNFATGIKAMTTRLADLRAELERVRAETGEEGGLATKAKEIGQALASLAQGGVPAPTLSRASIVAALSREVDELAAKLTAAVQKFGVVRQAILGAGPAATPTTPKISTTTTKPIADAQKADLEEANKALDAYRKNQEEISRAVAHAIVDVTSSTVDNLKLEIAELEKAFRAKGATEEELRMLVEPKRQALLVASAMDLAKKGLERLNASLKQPPGEALEPIVDQAFRAAEGIRDAANAGAGLATSLLGADSAAAKAFSSISQVVGAVAQLGTLVKSAGSLATLLSTGGGLLGAIGPLGGIIAGVGGLASLLGGRADPEEKRRAEILQENSRRLAELRDRIGEAIHTSATGSQLAAVRDVALTFPQVSGRDEFTGEDITTDVHRRVGDILADLRRVGVGLDDLREIARDFGITLSETPTVEQLAQLSDAVRQFRLDEFTKSFAGQLQALEASFKVFNIRDAVAQTQAFVATVAKASPAFAEAIKGIDLTSAAGRAKALEIVRDFYNQAIAGGELTADQLRELFGNLSPEEFVDSMTRIAAGLDEATIAANAFGVAVSDMNERFNVFDQSEPLSQLPDFTETFSGLAPAFADIFKDLDLTTEEGIAEAKRRARDLFARNARGELTDEQRGGLSKEDFQRGLGSIDSFFDGVLASIVQSAKEATDKAAAEVEEARKARNKKVIDRTTHDIDLDDLAPDEAFRAWVKAFGELSPAFRDFFSSFDLSSPEGIRMAREAAAEWFKGIEDGTIVVDTGSLTFEEFEDAVLGTIDAADKAIGAIQTLAQTIASAFSDIDLDLALAGITDPFERANAIISGLAKRIPELAGVLGGLDIRDPNQRRQTEEALRAFAQGADADTKKAILQVLNLLTGLDKTVADGVKDAVASAGGGGGSITSTGLDGLTERTGARIEELLAASYKVQAQALEIWKRTIGGILPVPSALQAPQIPAGLIGAGAGMGAASVTVTQNISLDFPEVKNARDVDADAVARKFSKATFEFIWGKLDRVGSERGERTVRLKGGL